MTYSKVAGLTFCLSDFINYQLSDFMFMNVFVLQEGEIKGNVKQSKPQKVEGKTKNEKPSGPKYVSSALVKKSKGGKSAEAMVTASNGGSVTKNSSLKHHQSSSVNERQANASKVRVDSTTVFFFLCIFHCSFSTFPVFLIVAIPLFF